MLRPPARTSNSFSRLVRSPQIKPTDDDHPLIQESNGDGIAVSSSSAHSVFALLNRFESRTAITKPSLAAVKSNESCANLRDRDNNTEVYVHHVAAGDTLPKIILQYQIPVQILRRANKLWANDSIQSRAVLLLPVKACDIRPELVDYFNSDVGPSATSTAGLAEGSLLSPNVPRQSSGLADTLKKPSVASKHKVTRQVSINGVGLVDVAVVRGAILSYFPPSSSPSQYRDSTSVVRAGIDEDIHNESGTYRDERSSFDTIRIGAGQIAANAYNGTQGLIRRLKDKKGTKEIDLIDL